MRQPLRGALCVAIVAVSATMSQAQWLDVDANGAVDVATDVVYVARRLDGMLPVPPSFRANDPLIPSDEIIAARIDAIGPLLDVDGNGGVESATDALYIARTLLGLPPVPTSLRSADPTIPPDATIATNVVLLLLPVPTPTGGVEETQTPLPEATPTPSSPIVSPVATDTSTPTSSPTRTPPLPTATPTRTSRTPSATASRTRTPTVSRTPSRTATITRTPTVSSTPTRSRTPSPTSSPVFSQTVTATRTATIPGTATRTPSASRTPTVTATQTATRTMTPTVSATPTRTPSRTASPMPSATVTRSPSPTRTPTVTATASATRTSSRTPSRSPTKTGTSSPLPSATNTPTRSATVTRSATSTPTITGTRTATATGTGTRTPTVTQTGTPTRTASGTRTATPTPTDTRTRTPTRTATITPTVTSTATITRTSTPSRTPTPRPPTATPTHTSNVPGPIITYFGLVRADGCRPGCFTGLICFCDATPTPIIENGIQVFHDQGGRRGLIVVEARRGLNNRAPGSALSVPLPCEDRPSLQIQSDRDLGDGSPINCGELNPDVCVEGIPGVAPPNFGGGESVTAALNEFACHFGSVTSQSDSCTQNEFGAFAFLGGFSSIQQYRQYCYNLGSSSLLPVGDTTFSVRVLDTAGTPGPTVQIKIRVATPTPPH